MYDGLFWFLVYGVLAVAAGIALGKYFHGRGDEAYIQKGRCAECGSKQLRLAPVDDESFEATCHECGAQWLCFVDAMRPVERVVRQRAFVPALRFHIDADRPAFVFEMDRARASFPMDFFKHMPMYGAATPRDMLQIACDNGIKPLDIWIDSTLLDQHESEALFEALTPEEHAKRLRIFYDYANIEKKDQTDD